jgi:prepilin-type N-terminal cleavage/methylation domain-containing protein
MHRSRGIRGFTFIESLITLVVVAVVVIGLYTLLDRSNKLAKQETNVSEAQQSSRVGIYELSRVIRQARVGGLFVGNAILPIENNSAGGTNLTDLSGTSHYVRKGTDVIGVRGIISGDKYYFSAGDITCPASCATTTSLTVTIHATSVGGVSNFASGSAPSLVNRTRSFYFAVAAGQNELVTIGAKQYLVPTYVVGLVNTAGTWYTQTATTFSFVMNPQDAGAKKLDAATAVASSIDKPFSGGVVDDVRFFVDEGPADATSSSLDTHPTLAEATLDPGTGQWDIQPLIEDVEDFQVAYGVDGSDGTTHDHGISPAKVDTTGSNLDEWVGNVSNEISTTLPLSGTDPKYVAGFVDTSVISAGSDPALVVAALRSVWLSLVVKSADPDFVHGGPGARGFQVLDSNIKNFSTATGRPYRRRIQSFAVSLRNYQ